MPFLMVNLDDPGDCRRAIQQLRSRVQTEVVAGRGRQAVGQSGRSHGLQGHRSPGPEPRVAELPLGQKLRRIRQRGIWTHLVQVASSGDQPRSLMELDEALGLPPNKMRSLKAIMAKLENRFAIRFLTPSAEAEPDAAGNPRYAMPPRIRTAILQIAEEFGEVLAQ